MSYDSGWQRFRRGRAFFFKCIHFFANLICTRRFSSKDFLPILFTLPLLKLDFEHSASALLLRFLGLSNGVSFWVFTGGKQKGEQTEGWIPATSLPPSTLASLSALYCTNEEHNRRKRQW